MRPFRRRGFWKPRFESFEPRLVMSANPVGELVVEYVVDEGRHADVTPALADAHDLTGLTRASTDYGLTGQGQTVVVIDSGVAYDHGLAVAKRSRKNGSVDRGRLIRHGRAITSGAEDVQASSGQFARWAQSRFRCRSAWGSLCDERTAQRPSASAVARVRGGRRVGFSVASRGQASP